jgi:hypothetical protein
MVAGPYSAPTAKERTANLRALNVAAAAVMRRGHMPVVGVNAALPVIEAADLPDGHPWTMDISLALAARCDAVLQIGRSPGADREANLARELGRPVYTSAEQLPGR